MTFRKSENHFLNKWKSHSALIAKRDSENQNRIFRFVEYDIPKIKGPFSKYVKVAFCTFQKTRFRKSGNDFQCFGQHSQNIRKLHSNKQKKQSKSHRSGIPKVIFGFKKIFSTFLQFAQSWKSFSNILQMFSKFHLDDEYFKVVGILDTIQ